MNGHYPGPTTTKLSQPDSTAVETITINTALGLLEKRQTETIDIVNILESKLGPVLVALPNPTEPPSKPENIKGSNDSVFFQILVEMQNRQKLVNANLRQIIERAQL